MLHVFVVCVHTHDRQLSWCSSAALKEGLPGIHKMNMHNAAHNQDPQSSEHIPKVQKQELYKNAGTI